MTLIDQAFVRNWPKSTSSDVMWGCEQSVAEEKDERVRRSRPAHIVNDIRETAIMVQRDVVRQSEPTPPGSPA